MNLSLRAVRRVTATAMTVGLAAGSLVMAGCTPQNTADKVISGTIQGSDGKIVDVYIGFDVLDAAGNKINLGGGPGYSATQRLNHCVSTNGASSSQACPTTGYVTGKTWSLRVPYNASKVFIEVYPKAPSTSYWLNNYKGYTGATPGSTNTSTYSLAYKSAMADSSVTTANYP